MTWFRKHHTCDCGAEWWDEWDCLCNDQCPVCGLKDIEPDDCEEIADGTGQLEPGEIADQKVRYEDRQLHAGSVINLCRSFGGGVSF